MKKNLGDRDGLKIKARLLGGRNRDRKEARRAKKRLQEPELRRRGEPERPESPNFPKFFPKRKMGGGKIEPGGIIYI